MRSTNSAWNKQTHYSINEELKRLAGLILGLDYSL
jgi:hypothetical protein